jgi:hypothetical protein
VHAGTSASGLPRRKPAYAKAVQNYCFTDGHSFAAGSRLPESQMENGPSGKIKRITTDEMVDALTEANTSSENALHRHVFREALRALVRLAKTEKLFEMKRDVALSIGLDPKRLPSPPGTQS